MALSLEQVRHVASLARLSLTADEERLYQEQLSAILEAFGELSALDTKDVEPTSHASLAGPAMRPDEPRPSLDPADAMANAPQKVGTSFAVPKILE